MTFPEYLYRMKAFGLSQLDRRYDIHLQAWLSRDINATKKQGDKEVYIYKSFKDFFDYDKELNEIIKKKNTISSKHKMLARIAARINK